MREPRWLTARETVRIHDLALRAHGGLPGIRDPHLVSASVSRARFKYVYEHADLAACAAAYAFAFARNHPFNDGNKRTAFGSMATFLLLNGHPLEADADECVRVVLATATRRLAEVDLASWVRDHLRTP